MVTGRGLQKRLRRHDDSVMEAFVTIESGRWMGYVRRFEVAASSSGRSERSRNGRKQFLQRWLEAGEDVGADRHSMDRQNWHCMLLQLIKRYNGGYPRGE